MIKLQRLALLAGLAVLACLALSAGAAAPDFSKVVTLEPLSNDAGKVSGLVRNIGSWTVRNVVVKVRHRWRWPNSGYYQHEDRAIVSRLVYPGEAAGFAAVHIPPESVPRHAKYSVDMTVLELTQIRIASD